MIINSPREILPLRYNIITMPHNLLSNMLPTGEHIVRLRSRLPARLIRNVKNYHKHKQASVAKITGQNERYLRAIQWNREQRDYS
jgi:hypothetical protein